MYNPLKQFGVADHELIYYYTEEQLEAMRLAEYGEPAYSETYDGTMQFVSGGAARGQRGQKGAPSPLGRGRVSQQSPDSIGDVDDDFDDDTGDGEDLDEADDSDELDDEDASDLDDEDLDDDGAQGDSYGVGDYTMGKRRGRGRRVAASEPYAGVMQMMGPGSAGYGGSSVAPVDFTQRPSLDPINPYNAGPQYSQIARNDEEQQSAVVALAHRLARQRFPGYELEELNDTDRLACLNAAVKRLQYDGSKGAPDRSVLRQDLAVAPVNDAMDLSEQERYSRRLNERHERRQAMLTEAVMETEEITLRLAEAIAVHKHDCRLEDLDDKTRMAVMSEASKRAGYGFDTPDRR